MNSNTRTVRALARRFTILTLLGAAATAPAEESGAGNPQPFDLGVIEVVEEPWPGSDWNQPMQATVDAEDMQRFDRYNVGTALNLLPGVTLQNVGGRSEGLIFVRGFNSRQVPMFIDGIPVYVPYDGNIDLNRMVTFDAAEINVTKGFTSMLYGANTLGGSINMVSRRPEETLEADAGSGLNLDSDGDTSDYHAYANLGTNQGNWYAQASASYLDRDHFRVPGDLEPTFSEDGGDRENSASEDLKVSLKVGWTPNETDEYALSYHNQQGEKQTPPYAGTNPFVRGRNWRWPEYDKESLYFISRTTFGQAEYVKLRAYYDKFDNTLSAFDDASYSTQFAPFAFNSVYDDYTAGGGIEAGTERFAGHNLRASFHYKRDVHRETDDDGLPWERYEDEIMSLGIEDSIAVTDKLTLIGGTSYDYQKGLQADNLVGAAIVPFPTDSASAVNFQAGVVYDITDSVAVRVSGSNRTRFPTIKDRYSFRFGSALPNPNLHAEEANNFEIGLNGVMLIPEHDLTLDYGAAVFYSDIEDAIENVSLGPTACFFPPCSQLQNIGEQRNVGFEALLTAGFGDNLEWHANYTWLDRDNQSSPDILLLDTPEHKFFTYLRYLPMDMLEFVASARYESKRYNSTFGDRKASPFVVGDAKAIWRPLSYLQAEAGVRNIGNELYGYEEGFPEPGRSYFVNLRLNY